MSKPKKKIMMLCFAHPFDDGRVSYREAALLKKKGFRLRIIGLHRVLAPSMVKRSYGVPALALPPRYGENLFLRLMLEPFYTIRFLAVCWKYSKWADVLHCHEYQSLAVGLFLGALRGQKVVYDCHEFQPELFAEMFDRSNGVVYKVFRALFSLYERALVKGADGVVTVNEFLVTRFRKSSPLVCNLPNYPSKKITREKQLEDEGFEVLRQSLDGKKVLLFIGYLADDRGVSDLIRIMSKLCSFRKDVTLLLVGGTGAEDYYTNLIQELGLEQHVIMTGAFKYNTFYNYVSLADVGIYLPSAASWHIAHSCSTKIFQYCSAGLPVVLNKTPAHLNLSAQSDFAMILENCDHGVAAKQISALLDDSRKLKKMGQSALTSFDSAWNAEAVESNLIEFYSNLFKDKS